MKTTVTNVLTNVQLADGFAMSRVRGTGALVGWHHVQAPACGIGATFSAPTYAPAGAASYAATRNPQLNPAQLPVIAALPVVKTAARPAMAKQHLVTAQGAGRGTEGSSPWKVPV
jgi:hypothetical protein